MNILFVEPPVDYPVPWVNVGCNLGIMSLIAHVKRNCDVHVDFFSFQYEKALGITSSIDDVLTRFNPTVICISLLTHALPFARQFTKLAKSRGCISVWGGIYVTYNAKTLLTTDPNVDFFVVGDGECVISDLINRIAKRTKFDNPVIISCSDDLRTLSYLPPDFSMIPRNLFHDLNLRATLEMAKGCSFRCKFCCVHDKKSASSVKKITDVETDFLNICNYDFRKLLICDNNFIPTQNRFSSLLRLKKEILPQMKVRVTVRLDLINEELLNQYGEFGVDEIILGVEHVDPRILDSMSKTNDPQNWKNKAISAVKLASQMGFQVHPIFMIGWPGETPYSLKSNVETACLLGTDDNVEPFVSFFTPHPGSDSENFIKRGDAIIITSDYSKFIHLYPVAIPVSYGQNALCDFIEAHNSIRLASKMVYRNPCLSFDFVRDYANTFPSKLL